jgi:hypothetical protein
MARAGAVLISQAEGRAFVPAQLARQIVPQTAISRVPYARWGMTLIGGRVVCVLELGEPSGALLLCEIDGNDVALSGLRLERVGFFEIDEQGAQVDGECVPPLPVAELWSRSVEGKAS